MVVSFCKNKKGKGHLNNKPTGLWVLCHALHPREQLEGLVLFDANGATAGASGEFFCHLQNWPCLIPRRGVFLPPFVRKLATPSKRNPSLRGGRSLLHKRLQKDPFDTSKVGGNRCRWYINETDTVSDSVQPNSRKKDAFGTQLKLCPRRVGVEPMPRLNAALSTNACSWGARPSSNTHSWRAQLKRRSQIRILTGQNQSTKVHHGVGQLEQAAATVASLSLKRSVCHLSSV